MDRFKVDCPLRETLGVPEGQCRPCVLYKDCPFDSWEGLDNKLLSSVDEYLLKALKAIVKGLKKKSNG